jgi:glutamate-5-semialdehyde dehydrogenase
METLLVHQAFAERHLTDVAAAMIANKVALRGCPKTVERLENHTDIEIGHAGEAEFATEYNDYMLNMKIVADLDEALTHIERYGTFHSECIVTENEHRAQRFLAEVDAAAVYHNASTRFTDGFEFGFGAEIGISTQKLHARGPMGLPALTSIKYKIIGNGQIRS